MRQGVPVIVEGSVAHLKLKGKIKHSKNKNIYNNQCGLVGKQSANNISLKTFPYELKMKCNSNQSESIIGIV